MNPGRNKIFIKQYEPETTTASGLLIPETVQRNQLYGTVVATGEYDKDKYGEISVGDKVAFGPYAGEKVNFSDGELFMLKPEDIYAIIRDDNFYSFGPSVIVEIEKKYNDQVELSDGTKLLYDPLYKPTDNLMYYGKVTSIPTIVPYNEQGHEINPVIEIGDTVYFRYISIDDDVNLLGKSVSDTSEKLIVRVFYSWIFAKEREDKVSSVGEWVLATPFIDAEGVDVEVQGESGPITIKVEYFPNSTIIKSSHTEKSVYKAVVEYTSTLIGFDENLKKGDIIFSRYRIDFKNTVSGKEYYCVRKSSIDAVVGNVECEKCLLNSK